MSKARQLADLGNQVDDGAITGTNMVINGAMTVAQRGTQTAQTSGYTACDRWEFAENGSSVVTTTQDANIPAGEGFGSSLKVDVTNASGTPSSGNYAFLRTKFEGQDLQHIRKGTSAAKPLTLSFWVSSPKTGIHVVELYDTDNDRQVSKSYTINSVNTWQHVSVSMPADTTGAFNDDSLISMQIVFWLMAGSNFSGGTLNTSWAANNNSNRAVGQVNCMDNTSNNFYLTGVCLNVGDSAIDFPHDESYGDTLAKCKRYFERIGIPAGSNYQSFGVGHVHTNVTAVSVIPYEVEKRANPTASYDTASNFALLNAAGGAVACTGIGTSRITTHAVSITANASGLVAGNATFLLANSAAKPFIDIEAEL